MRAFCFWGAMKFSSAIESCPICSCQAHLVSFGTGKMSGMTNDKVNVIFPPPPIEATELLSPITSWEDMFSEMRVTGVDFDSFWDESVEEGVAYFFRWTGAPRATVLVVWDDEKPTHIECRTYGDDLLTGGLASEIEEEVVTQFYRAGFWRNEPRH